MSSDDYNKRYSLTDAIQSLILTLASEPQGFSAHDLLREFHSDCNIDGEKLAKNNGFRSFEDFLNSDLMAKRLEIHNDPNTGRATYIAKPDHKFSHIYAEQMRSLRAKEQKQDKESTRNHISSAGTIGRKFYDEAPVSYRNFHDNYDETREQRQYSNENSNYTTNRFEERDRQDRYRNSDSRDDYDSQRYRDAPANASVDRREAFNDIGLRRQPTNNDSGSSKFASSGPTVVKSRSSGFGVGLDSTEHINNNKSFFGASKDTDYYNDSADSQRNVAPKSPFRTHSRDVREQTECDDFKTSSVSRSENSANYYSDERLARRYEDSDGYTAARHHFSDKSQHMNDLSEQNTPQNYNEFASRPARTPPPTAGKTVADIVWDEEEGDDFVEDAEEMSSKKRPPPQLKKPVQKYGGDYDDEESNEEQASTAKQQQKSVEQSQNVQEWTRRDPTAEYSDDDASDEEDEKNGAANANARILTKSSAFYSAPAAKSATPVKSQVPASKSSSETSTLHNHPQSQKNSSNNVERNETPPLKPFAGTTSLASSVAANSGTSSGVHVPASHGEKWLFEFGRQQAEKASRKPQPLASPSSSSENEHDDVFRPVGSTAKKSVMTTSTSVGGGVGSAESQSLRRPIPLKANNEPHSSVERSLTSSVISEGRNTPSDNNIVHPLRRTGSTVSVMSTLTARRWNRALTEDDLGKVAHMVNTIVQYYYPRTILMDDLIAVMEMIEPRFSTLEQTSGYEYMEFLSKFCKKIEVIGRSGNFNLLWRESDQQN